MSNNFKYKFLITYATWTGVTKEVAEYIGKVVRSKSYSVDLLPVNQVHSLSDYDCVVIGSSIHASQMVKDFLKFIKKYRDEIQNLPHAFFVVCANMNEDNDVNREETTGWLHNALEKIGQFKPLSLGLFAGALTTNTKEYQNQNIFVKKIIQTMQEKIIEDYGKSDFRDWDAITEWSNHLVDLCKNI